MDIELQIDLPHTGWKSKVAAVYQIVFDNGMFYIGGSINIKDRASAWRRILGGTNKKSRDMIRMRERVSGCKCGILSIVEYVTQENIQKVEYGYIKLHSKNPLLLNTYSFPCKPIIEYDMNGKEVARYTSASQASKIKKIKLARIREVLTGGRNHHLGCVYKYENESDFSYKPRRKPKEKIMKVKRYTTAGEYVDSFYSQMAAARASNIDKKGVYSVLNGKQRTAGGFVFKHA